jgi:hypothetical protein
MSAAYNAYATAARARKAARIIACADGVVTAEEVATDAHLRARLLADAGIAGASLETWGIVVTFLYESETSLVECIG